MNNPAILTMIQGATVPVVSNAFVNNASQNLTLQITGTFSFATVLVEGLVNITSSQWTTLATFNLTDLSLNTMSGMNDQGIYQVGIGGILRVRINVASVVGGDISVVANFVGETVTPYTASQPPANLEPTTQISNGAVTAEKISNGAVTNEKIANNTITYKKLVDGTLSFVFPEMFGAAGNGVVDDTAAIQTAIDNSDYVVFPSPKYLFHNLVIRRPITLDFRQAILMSPAPTGPLEETIDFAFSAQDIDGITILGGVFQRDGAEPCVKRINTNVSITDPNTGETLIGTIATYALSTTGVFLLNNCDNVRFDGCRFKESMTFSNIRCISCHDVEVTRCYTERYHGANIAFMDDCVNIKVHNCEMHNGKQIKLTGAYNVQPYIYAVCTGFQHYKPSTGDPKYYYDGIVNFKVSNCRIVDSDWEGIDSHGGTNIRFINNYIENCFRWITCYSDSRPALNPGVKFGNVLIENNECRNPINGYSSVIDVTVSSGTAKFSTYNPVAMLLHGDQNDDDVAENYIIRNNMLINPIIHSSYGIFNSFAIRNLTICQNFFNFLYTTELPEQYQNINYLFRLIFNYNAVISQNKIINHPATSAIFRLNCSSASITDNEIYNINLINRTNRLIDVLSGSKAYATVSGNKGTYTAVVLSNQPRLYGPNEFVINSAGLTGKVTKANVGLRAVDIADFPDIEGVAKVSDDDKTKIWYPGAINGFIPGEVLTQMGDGLTHFVVDVKKDYIYIIPATTLDYGASAKLHTAVHTMSTVFTP